MRRKRWDALGAGDGVRTGNHNNNFRRLAFRRAAVARLWPVAGRTDAARHTRLWETRRAARRVSLDQAACFFARRARMLSTSARGVAANSVLV